MEDHVLRWRMFEKFVVMDNNVSNGYIVILEIIKKNEDQNYRAD